MKMSDTKSSKSPAEKIVVLYNNNGSRKNEANFVAKTLGGYGYLVSVFDLEDDYDRVLYALHLERPRLLFSLIDEFYEDCSQLSKLLSLFDLLGYEYTGSESDTVVQCQDRTRVKQYLDMSNTNKTNNVHIE